MNSQGWIRGMIAKNMETEKYISHVVNCLQREFEIEANSRISGEFVYIGLGQYNTMITLFEAKGRQSKGPYGLDKYILEKLKEEGFEFDVMRSQYIMKCYGIYLK